MKTKLATLLLIGVGLGTAGLMAQTDGAQDANVRKLYNQQEAPQAQEAVEVMVVSEGEAEELLPLVQFEDAPLVDVIKTLARQASLNVIFDPAVLAQGPGDTPLYPDVSIRLEDVTAQHVLEAVLNNNNLRLEKDPKTKISRVTIKDPAAAEPLETKIYQLAYTNPTNLVTIIKPTLSPRSQVIPDGRTSQLIVLATEKEIIEIDTLIEQLDTATKQVLIEARILETLKNPSTIKGINWSGTFEAQNVTFGNNNFNSSGESLNPTVTPGGTPSIMGGWGTGAFTPATAFLNADGAQAVFSFFNQDTESEVIATPRAVTVDNQAALLSVTQAIPIYRVTQGGTQTGNSVDITYTNIGTILEVTPRISANSNIALKVVPEVSDVERQDEQIIDGEVYTANVFAIRRITTHVLIPSGNTLVLGGLISDASKKTSTKVPILGDLPGMKYIFGSHGKSRRKANLLIIVTPTLIEDNDFQPTESTFLQTAVPVETDMTDMGSFDKPWDGTEPFDWGKPVY